MMNGGGNVYGGGYQYGWQDTNGQEMGRSNGVMLPLEPRRRHHYGGGGGECANCFAGCGPINWHTFGIVLGFFASASCALGVADVVLTYQNYMVAKGCQTSTTPAMCDPNNLVFTWVGVGIWASVPVFILAIVSIRSATKVGKHGCWEFLAFVCTFIFTAAMIILSALEAFKGAGVYYWPPAPPLTTDDQAKAAIPITIACLGFVEHIMCAIAMWAICCCKMGPGSMTMTHGMHVMEQAVPAPAPAPVMRSACSTCPQTSYAPRAQMFPASASCGPCNQGSPKFSGSFYAGNAGFGGRPWSGVNNYSSAVNNYSSGMNNYSNMRPTSVVNTGQSWSTPIQPSSAYNFYNR